MGFLKRVFSWFAQAFKKPAEPVVVKPTPPPPVAENPAPSRKPTAPTFALSWEKTRPERAAWTRHLVELLTALLPDFDKASDVHLIHPDYKILSIEERIRMWAEFISAVTYFESSWNPATASKDVGTEEDKRTWSVGLLQLSAIDQESYRLPFGYEFDDLKDPIKNLNLGVRIMAHQIRRRGKIFIGKGEAGLYWAVIHPGGKYDKTQKIIDMVRDRMDVRPIDETPWMTIAMNELGVKEVAGSGDNPRVVEYLRSTSLDRASASQDETPWCAAFTTWCLEKAGCLSMKSAWARSYLNCGTKIPKGKYGAIVVLTRGTSSGHVGFFLDETDDMVYLLGGNQTDAVTKQWYAKSRVLGYRWPVRATNFEHDVASQFV